MRITKISVKKLFGVFDHEIPLNQESRITIIHGPNGVGKTILMRMVDGLLRRDYQVFTEVPFAEFGVATENREIATTLGVTIHNPPVASTSETDKLDRYTLEIQYTKISADQTSTYTSRLFRPRDSTERRALLRTLHNIDSLEYLSGGRWFDHESQHILTTYGATVKYNVNALLDHRDEPLWVKAFKDGIETHLIRAERLSIVRRDGMQHREAGEFRTDRSIGAHAVEEISTDVVHRVDQITERFLKNSNDLDSTFPERVIDEGDISIDEALKEELQRLGKRRNALVKLGLLDEHGARSSVDPSKASATERADEAEPLEQIFFSTYIEDNKTKLDTFNHIFSQLSLLTSIVNSRFQYKKLSIHRRIGFVITTHDDNTIPLRSLSSGEQHELVLLYQLLLETKPNSLIMIDEPEISLHVNWQEQFLNDIQRISDLGKFDVLIATHSPDIISDKHEWMVELGATESA